NQRRYPWLEFVRFGEDAHDAFVIQLLVLGDRPWERVAANQGVEHQLSRGADELLVFGPTQRVAIGGEDLGQHAEVERLAVDKYAVHVEDDRVVASVGHSRIERAMSTTAVNRIRSVEKKVRMA